MQHHIKLATGSPEFKHKNLLFLAKDSLTKNNLPRSPVIHVNRTLLRDSVSRWALAIKAKDYHRYLINSLNNPNKIRIRKVTIQKFKIPNYRNLNWHVQANTPQTCLNSFSNNTIKIWNSIYYRILIRSVKGR